MLRGVQEPLCELHCALVCTVLWDVHGAAWAALLAGVAGVVRAAARRQRRALLLLWGQQLCQVLPVPCARP